MSDQTIVDVVINDSTATVVDNRDLSNLTIDLNATGQLLTNNLISSGNYLDSEIAIVSGIAQSGSNESLTGQINQLSGNLITTGQTLQTQITSNDSDITSLTSNLVTTGQTLTTDITTVSGLIVDNDGDITALKTATGVLKTSTDSNAANLITTGQTLQTQITSNDSDINTLTTNLATTGETLTSEINSISGVVPTGGATNQVLAKINSANYNTQWVDQSGGGGGSGTVTSSTATTNYLTKWTNGAGEVIGNSVAYDNGSNIGIGTATPSSKLHILTSGGSTISENVVAIFQANTSSAISSGGGTAIKFKGVSSGGNQQNYDQGMISTFGYSTNNMHGMKFYYKPNSSTALTEGMRLNSSGFLSVGGQDASEKLHVFGGNIAVDNTYTIGGVNGSTGLSVSGSTLALKTGNVERAKISNDKFTIGGTVYSSLATVFNVKDSQDSSFNSGIGVFRSSGAQATYINMVGGNFNLNAPTGASTQFKVAGTNTLTILANGSVGIGTTNPSSKLHVYGGDANINTLNIGLGAGSVSSNTSIGLDSLSSNTTGSQNVAVGYQTLLNNTEGIRNIAVGYQSLNQNTEGDNNVSIGWQSLYYNTTGYHNIAHGYRSLFTNTTGNENTAVGYLSLSSNTIGASNVANGFGALSSNTTGSRNVTIGNSSLGANTTGSQNAAGGHLSLYGNTTGRDNTAFGFRAGWLITDGSTANTTGAYNVFIGSLTKALADNDQNEIVIGYNTTGVGSNSAVLGNDSITKTVLKGNVGIGTTSPSSKLHVYGGDAIINTLNIGLGAGTNNGANTSIGLSALSSNTSGVNNTAVGEYALRGNTVGINNAAFGSRSLYNNIDGDHNTAIGHYALYSNYSSDSNTAVGLGALRNTNGSNNTAIGFYSLYRNSTGTYNVANGFEAGHYIADGSTPHFTGDYNIFIGADTKALADNDQNEIVIGYNATGAGSNSAVLGNDSITKTILKGAVEFKVSGSNTFAVATNGSISSSTGASLSSGGTWTDASTRELKQDIKDLEYRESLNIIKQLNPVKFAYKKDPENKKIGFIAEDVPDLVATEDRKGLSALQIVSALTKVVQSQQKEIQQLKRMLKRLNKIK